MAYKKTSLTEKLGLSTRVVASYDLTKISAPATDQPTDTRRGEKKNQKWAELNTVHTNTEREREQSRAMRFATF